MWRKTNAMILWSTHRIRRAIHGQKRANATSCRTLTKASCFQHLPYISFQDLLLLFVVCNLQTNKTGRRLFGLRRKVSTRTLKHSSGEILLLLLLLQLQNVFTFTCRFSFHSLLISSWFITQQFWFPSTSYLAVCCPQDFIFSIEGGGCFFSLSGFSGEMIPNGTCWRSLENNKMRCFGFGNPGKMFWMPSGEEK